MRIIRFISRYPLIVLGLFVLAFVVWLSRATNPAGPPPLDEESIKMAQSDPDWPPRKRLPATPPGIPMTRELPHPGEPHPLSKIKPGMTRAEVEELVGAPAPNDIHPVKVVDGKVTYHTTYEADLGPLPTVRPVTPRPKDRNPAPNAKTLVTLEYDATKPGHPLLGIHYPDPLF